MGELAAHRQVGLLDNVGGIDPALEPSIHAQLDHALQPIPMAFDKDSQGALVAIAGGVQQFLVGLSVGAHKGLLIPLRGNAFRTVTAWREFCPGRRIIPRA